MVKEVIFRTIGSAKLYVMRNSDKILLFGGIACAGGAVITAAKNSTRLNDTLKDCNDRIAKIKAEMANESDVANGVVDLSIKKKELTKEYIRTGKEIGKLYIIPSVLFASGVCMIFGSHHIMQQRLASTTALLTLTQNQFNAYRERVKGYLGEEKEKMIFNNQTEKTVESTDENGNKVKTKILVNNGGNLGYNQVLWGKDSLSGYFKYDPDNSLTQLKGIQNRLDWLLRTRGYLFLEDVYYELGIDLYKISPEKLLAIKNVGWVYDPQDPEINDFIDMGLYDPETGNLTRDAKELDLGIKDDIVLTFNCAGDIVNGPRKYPDYMNNKRGWTKR